MPSIDTQLRKEYPLRSLGLDAIFSPDGRTIAVISRSGTLDLMDIDGRAIAKLKAYETSEDPYSGFCHTCLDAQFSSDGQKIVMGLTDGTARLWNIAGEELSVFRGHQGDVIRVWFSNNGERLFTFSLDNTFRVWDLQGNQLSILGKLKKTFSQNETFWDIHQIRDFATQVFLSPDSQFVFFLPDESFDSLDGFWHIDSQERRTFKIAEGSIQSPIAFNPSDRTIVASCTDGTARIWNWDGKELERLPDVKASRFSFSPNGKLLAIASAFGNLSLWDFQTGRKLRTKEEVHEILDISALSFDPSGQFLLTAGLNDGTVKIWDLYLDRVALLHRGDMFILGLRDRVLDSGKIVSARFSPDGRYIVAVSQQANSAPGYVLQWQVTLESKTLQQASDPLANASFQDVVTYAKRLPVTDRVRLIREVSESVEQDL